MIRKRVGQELTILILEAKLAVEFLCHLVCSHHLEVNSTNGSLPALGKEGF